MNRFKAMLEFMLRRSGGQFELTHTAAALGITRPTVQSHLRALEISHAVTVVRPFHGGGQLVTPSGDPAYDQRYGNLDVRVCTPAELGP